VTHVCRDCARKHPGIRRSLSPLPEIQQAVQFNLKPLSADNARATTCLTRYTDNAMRDLVARAVERNCTTTAVRSSCCSGVVAAEAASPNASPATVTMADGSRYRGALISKNRSQMTFRGDNGATRTLDSRDIQSVRSDYTNSFGHSRSPSQSAVACGRVSPHCPAVWVRTCFGIGIFKSNHDAMRMAVLRFGDTRRDHVIDDAHKGVLEDELLCLAAGNERIQVILCSNAVPIVYTGQELAQELGFRQSLILNDVREWRIKQAIRTQFLLDLVTLPFALGFSW
jgi:hypothetical protein